MIKSVRLLGKNKGFPISNSHEIYMPLLELSHTYTNTSRPSNIQFVKMIEIGVVDSHNFFIYADAFIQKKMQLIVAM